MSILFADTQSRTQSPRHSTAGLGLGVIVHAIAVVVIAVTIGTPAKPSVPRMQPRMVFFPAMSLPSAPIVTPLAPPPSTIRPPASPELPKPVPVAPVAARVVESAPEPLMPSTPSALEQRIDKPEVARPVETGLFERTNGVRMNHSANAVTTGGFGSGAAQARDAASDRGAVTTGGFNSVARAVRAAPASGEVQTAGFDLRSGEPSRPSAAASMPPIDRPVEIVFKPTPEYTEEARNARIEGTVSLELEFSAAGTVRVLRVVRGLGHGLDEAAQRAALRIRFKPAQSNTGPVDSRATVHITFRLS